MSPSGMSHERRVRRRSVFSALLPPALPVLIPRARERYALWAVLRAVRNYYAAGHWHCDHGFTA
jgi:hypothetical protein